MLSNRLRELREEKGIGQEEVAKSLNVARSTYSNWENGRNEPPISILRDIANFYSVSIDFLCCNTDIRENFYKDKKVCQYINDCLKIYRQHLRP